MVKSDISSASSQNKTRQKAGRNKEKKRAKKFVITGCLCIFFLAWAVYANSIGNGFSNWDDPSLIVKNQLIRHIDFQQVIHIFTPHSGTFQPVRLLSYMIDYHFWKLNPAAYHIHNIFLHGFAGVFLFLFLLRIIPEVTGLKISGSSGIMDDTKIVDNIRWIALFTTMIFIVHPVNVESVTWLSSRKYCLLSFFTFASAYFFVLSSAENKYHPVYALIAFLSMVLAVLSSPFGVVIPLFFLLCDYCRDQSGKFFRVLKKRLIYHLPYLIAGICLLFLLLHALVSSVSSVALRYHGLNMPWYIFLTTFRIFFDYFRNLVLPFWLNNRYVDYMAVSIFRPKVIIGILAFSAVFIMVLRRLINKDKFPLFCLGWFLIFWSPTSNIIPISTKMADRYIYLAAPGFWLFIVFYLFRFSYKFELNRLLPRAVLVVLLIFFSYKGIQRNKVWKNSITLWSDSVAKDPRNPIAHYNLGYAFDLKGDAQKAIQQYRLAVKIDPKHYKARLNLGILLFASGKHEEGMKFVENALKINPRFPKAWDNLGVMLFRTGDVKGAIKSFLNARSLSPENPSVYYNIGVLLFNTGKYRKAVDYFLKAVKFNPQYAQAYNNLGAAYYALDENKKAIANYKMALKFDPKLTGARKNLAAILEETETSQHKRKP